MMNGGDLYELAKILGHANIKMTERYAKLGKNHIARTSGYRYLVLKGMVARDGIEPPTPAFSGLRSTD